jgi:hypothetical protein
VLFLVLQPLQVNVRPLLMIMPGMHCRFSYYRIHESLSPGNLMQSVGNKAGKLLNPSVVVAQKRGFMQMVMCSYVHVMFLLNFQIRERGHAVVFQS